MIDLDTPCMFLPNKPEKNGYVNQGRRKWGTRLAHRKAYIRAYGAIPEGYSIDHECHNADPDCLGGACIHRACVNPLHLIARPARDNTLSGKTLAAANAAKEACPKGHPYSTKNTLISGSRRYCRYCLLLRQQEKYRKKKAQEWGLSLSDVGMLS